MKRSVAAVATVETPAARLPVPAQRADDLDPLRRRLAGATAREAVLVDFLEDDLREAEAAVAELGAWLSAVSSSVRDPRVSRHELMALAARAQGADGAEYLGAVLGSVRRRIAQVAVSLARAGD